MITITINGKEIKLEKPVTILEAAKANGIKIPHFCHHQALELWGGCRMCLVEVEKMPRLQTACTLYVTDGMSIRTESEAISKARRSVLEFLLINHPLECPVCDKAGECKLQDYTMQYGPTAGRFEEGKRKMPESLADPLIVRNSERCILCTRCVRMCDGVQGASALAVTSRGGHSVMEPFSGGAFNCEYCGNCLTVCPVGAIMSRLHRYVYRSWQVSREVQTICSFCGVGCTLLLQIRDNSIKRTIPKIGLGLNKGLLCNRGRFGYEYVESEGRLNTPLVRKNGKLEPSTWDEALLTVSRRLLDIKRKYGGNSIAGIAGARCTNEENYLFQKLLRAGLGTNNIDSIARMGFAGAERLLNGILGEGATANPISGIMNSDAVIVFGGDPTHINPILGIQIRGAFRKGANLITIGHAPGLSRHRTIGVAPRAGTEGILIEGILSSVLKNKPLRGENKELEEKISSLKLSNAEDITGVCAVSKEEINRVLQALEGASTVSVVVGRDVLTKRNGVRTLALLSCLTYALGGRIYLMSERPNEQGLIDMGCLPDMLPGERPIEIESFRKRYEDAWTAKIPATPGLTLMEMFEAGSQIKAMFVMGENPLYNLPDTGHIKDFLEKVEFLVVQDIFMTETAGMAHVVLPALSWAEKEGTYTNLERRIQFLSKAVAAPLNNNCMEDWKIISELGKQMGLNMPYNSSEDILKEIAEVSPVHSGLSYKEIQTGKTLWPYRGKPLGVEFSFPDIKPVDAGGEEAVYLMLEKPLFHSGTLSRMSPALNKIYPQAVVRMAPETAEKFALKEGDTVKVSSEKGSIALQVKVDGSAPPATLLLTNNFKDKGAMGLFDYAVDPETKTPVIKTKNIKVQKVSG